MPEPYDGATQRWRLDVAYDGAGFAGWATQPGLRTVAGELERWIGTVLRLDPPPSLVCAGRTDAGVHARGQVAQVDVPADLAPAPEELARRLARVLPPDLVVRSARVAPVGFDARFAAVWRRYVYRLADDATGRDPLLRGFVQDVPGTLDLDRLSPALPALLGLHDFAAFCKRREGATTIRTLLDLDVRRVAEGPLAGVVEVTVRADAFCHSMVRSLVGALVAVADSRRDADWLTALLDAPARDSSVPVLPARGLTLEEVGYPADDALAARAAEARSVRVLA
ncbi:tRNA pseudouridine(38-40) synthase TruA [Microlunatus flavus]|uniref:tRNA pseudouridine synthase A n=1 Tax=Microlunatus flavus TaxID=1036181 RepID=A0A1H9ME67_9ACTN|nr:tRNA pseudouridine(38-40) synthase TruA [Microlunatus flavus]SER21998.1 tRNA pseudouridine38-40 synthase [Microlunatus flavus]